MRNKIVVVIAIILLCGIAFLIYSSYSSKKVTDYIDDEAKPNIDIGGFEYYQEGVTQKEALDCTNMLELMGCSNDVEVVKAMLAREGDDFDRDLIEYFTDTPIDYDSPAYSAMDGTDTYLVYTDVNGSLRGIHLDWDYNLIELR